MFRRKLRGIGKIFILLVLSCTVGLLLAEALCRVALPPTRHWFPKGMYVSDPVTSYRLAPNFSGEVETPFFKYKVRTSSQGFRGPEFKQNPDKKLVGLFGDSFTFGQGVEEEDCFAGMLAQGLAPSGYQVINAGVYAYDTSQEYGTYDRVNRECRIDIVVLQIFWNDIADHSQPIKRGVYRGYLNASPPDTAWGKFKNQLFLSSEFVNQVILVGYKLRAARLAPPAFLSPGYELAQAREINSTEQLLTKWARETAERNQQFVVVYTPHEWQVDQNAPAIRRWKDEGRQIDLEAPHRWLMGFLRQQPQIVYIDVLEAFRRHYQAGGSTLYIAGDGHANPQGNRLIAEAIRNRLLQANP